MSYIELFKQSTLNNPPVHTLKLWEEYCLCDDIDLHELKQILELFHEINFKEHFGKFAETAVPLLEKAVDTKEYHDIIMLILDLQTTNSSFLANIANDYLTKHYANSTHFRENIRLIGLQSKQSFTGAIRNFLLLHHISDNKFVYHKGGWGTGEVMNISFVREQIELEFENVIGNKQLSFSNGFNMLKPLPNDHFYARRFGDPDSLEAEANKHPVKVMKMLLRDLGPKTALEIKELMKELIINAADWSSWWSNTRTKLKRDVTIYYPKNSKERFSIMEDTTSHLSILTNQLSNAATIADQMSIMNLYIRDYPKDINTEEFTIAFNEWFSETSLDSRATASERISLLMLKKHVVRDDAPDQDVENIIESFEAVGDLIQNIPIQSHKKRALEIIKDKHATWTEIYCEVILSPCHTQLKDYILKELAIANKHRLSELATQLKEEYIQHKDTFFWYFQKILTDTSLPYGDSEGLCEYLESYLILLHECEYKKTEKSFVKKLTNFITGNKFNVIRTVLKASSLDFAKEFLLLLSKCYCFSDHDQKVMESLATVVHPKLVDPARLAEEKAKNLNIIWATESGYENAARQLEKLTNVELIENTNDIKTARAHGDLRENAEYKIAIERRNFLYNEIKILSKQIKEARILTPNDVRTDQVSAGTTVTIINNTTGEEHTYTILGPWEASTEKNILSFQSKLVQAMAGKSTSQTFDFDTQTYTIKAIESIFQHTK